MKLRLVRRQAIPVVPLPMNGSKMVSPSADSSETNQTISASGLGEGWSEPKLDLS